MFQTPSSAAAATQLKLPCPPRLSRSPAANKLKLAPNQTPARLQTIGRPSQSTRRSFCPKTLFRLTTALFVEGPSFALTVLATVAFASRSACTLMSIRMPPERQKSPRLSRASTISSANPLRRAPLSPSATGAGTSAVSASLGRRLELCKYHLANLDSFCTPELFH